MRRVRAMMAAVVLAIVGTAGAVAVSVGPAQAGGNGRICFPVHEDRPDPYHVYITRWICIPELYVEVPEEVEPPCRCPDLAIDLRQYAQLREDEQVRYLEAVSQGMHLLDLAAHIDSPERAADLREQALAEFTGAVRAVDGAQIDRGPVGFADVENGAVYELALPGLEAADQHLVQGLNLLALALRDPELDPGSIGAMSELEAAYAELTQPAA